MLSEPTVQTRIVSLRGEQWYQFELLHNQARQHTPYQRTATPSQAPRVLAFDPWGIPYPMSCRPSLTPSLDPIPPQASEGNRKLEVQLSCPGDASNLPPGTPFPTGTSDPSLRRRNRAHPEWPRWPSAAASPAVSRVVPLVAGERYWLHLECEMGGLAHDPPSAPPPPPPLRPPISPPAPPPPSRIARIIGNPTTYAGCDGYFERGQETTTSWWSTVPKLVWNKVQDRDGNPSTGRVWWWGWGNVWICSWKPWGGGYASGCKDCDEWCEGEPHPLTMLTYYAHVL